MKFKFLSLVLALMFSTSSTWADNYSCVSNPLVYFNLELFIKKVSGITCFEGKDLKTQYVEVCACAKNLPPDQLSVDKSIEDFQNRAKRIMLANSITSISTQEKENTNRASKDLKTRAKDYLQQLKNNFTNKETKAEVKNQANKNLAAVKREQAEERALERKKYQDKVRECGYNVDEYRRMSLIPSFDLMDSEESVIENDNQGNQLLWQGYLRKNPKLMAIDANLPESNKLDFRKEVMNRMREIRKKNEKSQIFGESYSELLPDGGVAVGIDKSHPERALWKLVDDDFEKKGGGLNSILSKYNAISSPRYLKLMDKSREILDTGKNGFEPNFMHIATNDVLWNLYFKGNDNASSGCGLKDVSDRSSGLSAMSCLDNVRGFCGLYENSKVLPKEKNLNTVAGWEFGPLLEVEAAFEETRNEHKKQVEIICDTKSKMGFVEDKNGNPLNVDWTIEDFKKRFCVDKDVKISKSLDPAISDNELSVACLKNDFPKLQGFYQRMIDSAAYSKAMQARFSPEEFKNLKISTMRNYLKEKSKFDMQTSNIEDNVTVALTSGNPKEAAKILAASRVADESYLEDLRSLYSGVEPIKSNVVLPDNTKPSVLSTTALVNPSEPIVNPVGGSGYMPTAPVEASAQAQLEQNVSEEAKKIVETKQQIETLEDKKNELPPSSPQVSDFEKQIQDLRNQLAKSEARYQSALEDLKKSKQPVVVDNDKSTGGGNSTAPVGRSPANTPVLGNETNVVGPYGNNQATTGGSASVSGAGKLTGGGQSSNASTNRALLQANNVDLNNNGKMALEYGLVLSTVKDKDESIGVVADPKIYDAFKNNDTKLQDRYIQEMLTKNLATLIVRNGENVLYYKLVSDDKNKHSLQLESRPIKDEERKYFRKDLTNFINSSAQVTQ